MYDPETYLVEDITYLSNRVQYLVKDNNSEFLYVADSQSQIIKINESERGNKDNSSFKQTIMEVTGEVCCMEVDTDAG